MSPDPANPAPLSESADGQLLVHPGSLGKRVRLARWFAFFAIYLAAMIVLMRVDVFGLGDTAAGFRLRMVMFLAIYMSLACTFVPLPVNAVIFWAAAGSLGLVAQSDSGLVARILRAAVHGFVGDPHGAANLADSRVVRVLLIAFVGALATMMSNVNEYYIVTAILRWRRVASVRNTRVYRLAVRWFERAAGATVAAFAFLPLPVDVVRLLAITYQYPVWRFAAASFAGRFVRYAFFAGSVVLFDRAPKVQWWLIIGVAVLTIGAGLLVALPKMIRALRR